MDFIALSALILLSIVASAAVFWYSGRARWMRPGPDEPTETAAGALADRPGAQTARLALSFCTLTALTLYLAVGAPYIALFETGSELDERAVQNNIAVLERFVNARYGAGENQKTDEFARAQYQLAEYLLAAEDYLQASEKLGRLYELWPQETDLQRHYLLALSFASLRASSQGRSGQAGLLRERIRFLTEKHPYLRDTVRDVFARYLSEVRKNRSAIDSPSKAVAPAEQTDEGERSHIRLQMHYPDPGDIEPDAVLFVSAHRIGADAPKMPVAAQKHTRQPFPEYISLDSGDLLLSGADLNDYPELEIRARIAQSGTIERHKDDMIGSAIIRTGSPTGFWPVRFSGAAGADPS